MLDHATSEIAMGSKMGFDATRKMAGEGFKRPWPPLIKMVEREGKGGTNVWLALISATSHE